MSYNKIVKIFIDLGLYEDVINIIMEYKVPYGFYKRIYRIKKKKFKSCMNLIKENKKCHDICKKYYNSFFEFYFYDDRTIGNNKKVLKYNNLNKIKNNHIFKDRLKKLLFEKKKFDLNKCYLYFKSNNNSNLQYISLDDYKNKIIPAISGKIDNFVIEFTQKKLYYVRFIDRNFRFRFFDICYYWYEFENINKKLYKVCENKIYL